MSPTSKRCLQIKLFMLLWRIVCLIGKLYLNLLSVILIEYNNFIRMTSQNNFNKLRRLSNSIETRSRYSTLDPDRFSQAVKLPALNSINRSIKYNDISFTLSRDLNKLRKEPQAEDQLAQSLAHSSLLTVRRRYDNLSKDRETEQNNIRRLEQQRDKFKIEQTRFQEQKASGQKKVKSMQQSLSQLKISIEESDMQRKIMNSMIARLKFDKLVYEQRKINREKTLVMIDKQKHIILKEEKSKREEEDKTKKVYQKMVEHIEADEQAREEHISSMQYMIDNKVQAYEGSILKKSELKEIAEITLSEKDSRQKNWYKVYLCQRFVEKMLRDKMAREMNKFGTVEQAYKNIKTATGVSTTEALIAKFLHKEAEYGDLLGKITLEQSQILNLKAQNDALNKERRKLRAERDTLSVSKQDETDLTKQEKQYNNISQKSAKCYLFDETMKAWVEKNVRKYRKLSKGSIKLQEADQSSQFINYFKQFLNILKEEVQNSGDIQGDPYINESVTNDKNFRIQFNNSEQNLNAAEKRHKETTVDQHQDDFINQLREQTLKNNEKFMKELKKKFEEIRKQKIDAQPKRKEAPIDKPKQSLPEGS